jgi:anti-anti-sigma regulatory factor
MYKRIYRLVKRQIDPRVIANTLNIPVRTVEGIITRLEKSSVGEFSNETGTLNIAAENQDGGFLDIYMYTKTRYAVMEIVGTLTSQYLVAFTAELEKAYNSSLKAFAIRMVDITQIDEQAAKTILEYFEKFQSYGRYLAILDPSPNLESLLIQYKIDQTIPIFGTERAFEDAAFSRSSAMIKRGHA